MMFFRPSIFLAIMMIVVFDCKATELLPQLSFDDKLAQDNQLEAENLEFDKIRSPKFFSHNSTREISREEFRALVSKEDLINSVSNPWVTTGLTKGISRSKTIRFLKSEGWVEVLKENFIKGQFPEPVFPECSAYRFEQTDIFIKQTMSRPPKEYVLHAKFSPCVNNDMNTANRLLILELLEKNNAKNK